METTDGEGALRWETRHGIKDITDGISTRTFTVPADGSTFDIVMKSE